MRAVVQRVKASSVAVEGNVVGSIKEGLNILLGIYFVFIDLLFS